MDHDYTHLPSQPDGDNTEPTTNGQPLTDDSEEKRASTHSKIDKFLTMVGLIGVATLILILMISRLHTSTKADDTPQPRPTTTTSNLCKCSPTIQEALNQNCTYDSLSSAWLPPYCRDDALTVEFERSASNGKSSNSKWQYFAYENGTSPLNKTEVAQLGDTCGSFWVPNQWQLTQCVFNWEKYNRTQETGVVLEERLCDEGYVQNCVKMIQDPDFNHTKLIEVPVRMNGKAERDCTAREGSEKMKHGNESHAALSIDP